MESKARSPTSVELYQQARELCSTLEARYGETNEVIDEAIDTFLADSENKLDRHRYAIDYFKTMSQLYRADAQRLQARARMMMKTVDRIKQHAITVLEGRCALLGDKKGRSLTTAHGLVYLQNKTTMVIDDPEVVLSALRGTAYVDVIETEKLDRNAISSAMKNGTLGPSIGARLVESHIVIFK